MPLADVSPPKANIQAPMNDDAMDHLLAEKVFEDTMAYKTRICKFIAKKQPCPYGDRCRFAHHAKDLYSRDDNFFAACQKKMRPSATISSRRTSVRSVLVSKATV